MEMENKTKQNIGKYIINLYNEVQLTCSIDSFNKYFGTSKSYSAKMRFVVGGNKKNF
jgi:hypothetical protein